MRFFRDFFKNRGERVITCPETEKGAAVRIDALHAARTGEVRLADCTRWPERAGCDEACVPQIAASPHGCLVQALAADWYLGKSCAMCGRAIGPIVWHEAPPAVLKEDGTTSEWTDIALQTLPDIFRTSKPLCWNCNNVLELDARLITKRPAAPEGPRPLLKNDNVF